MVSFTQRAALVLLLLVVHAGASRPSLKVLGSLQVSSGQPRVAYLVKSDSAFYSSRLQWVRETWAADVGPDLLVVVGDQPHEGVLHTTCEAHSHSLGLCCKFAQGLKHMVQQKSFDWVVVIDDDAYANVAGMRTALPMLEGSAMMGIVGCGAKHCGGGFCGGGGYALNRKAAEALVKRGFEEEFMSACKEPCKGFEDITVALLGRRRGMKAQSLKGLHGWSLKPEELKHEVSKCHPEPLTFHYLRSEGAFKRVHSYIRTNVRKCHSNGSSMEFATSSLEELSGSLNAVGREEGSSLMLMRGP